MFLLTASIRSGVRQIVRRPGEAAMAVLVLALGIGLAGTAWAVVWGTYLRPLPFPDGDRLVRVTALDEDGEPTSIGAPAFRALRENLDQLPELERIEAWLPVGFDVAGLAGPSTRAKGAYVSPGLLALSGTAPVDGRLFVAGDAEQPVVIVAADFWQRHLGARPVGEGDVTLRLYGETHTVVGVLRSDFRFPYSQEIWVPERERFMDRAYLQVLARRSEGVDAAVLADRLRAVSPRDAQGGVESQAGRPVVVERFADAYHDAEARVSTELAAWGAVAVLLLACANVTQLLLARGLRRRRELAVRASLGARAGELRLHLLGETSVLAIAGGALGLGLSRLGIQLYSAIAPRFGPSWVDVRLDGAVLVAVCGLVALAALGAGMAPAWRAGRVDLVSDLRSGGGRGGARQRGDGWLVVAQVASSVALLATTALLARGVDAARDAAPTLQRDDVVTARFSIWDAQKQRTAREWAVQWQEIVQNLEALPEVRSAAFSTHAPDERWDGMAAVDGAGVDGKAVEGARNAYPVGYSALSPGALELLGATLVAGRDIASGDHLDGAPVAWVDTELAERLFPGLAPRDVVGRVLRVGHLSEDLDAGLGSVPARTIAGVVALPGRPIAAGHERALGHVYLSSAQMEIASGYLLAGLRSHPNDLEHRLASAAEKVAPGHPLHDLRTLDEVLAERLSTGQSARSAFLILGAVALAFAAAGLYGVLAVAVARRRHEMGVRSALGASPSDLRSLVLGRSLRLVGAGSAAGLLAALWLGHALRALVANLAPDGAPWDPAALAAAVAVLLVTGLLAAWAPARRAAAVDPVAALVEE